ncbi:ABC transporter ATP-binding protein [Amycolatopsis sp. NBC_00348]|uniref:nSTAND1 domain-containing NTPase n=1 Tax=Amycolatopsis sp. NBC_00348 TaxID=2975956 RepID=UPI002E2724A9
MADVVTAVRRSRRVDERGQVVHVSIQRISDWRRGRNVPARFAVFAAVLDVLFKQARLTTSPPPAGGLYSPERWRAWWEAALESPAGPQPRSATAGMCPYPGLAAYTPADSAWFFGRRQAAADLLARLERAGSGIVALTGASGSGKSSLIAAGILPALRAPSSTAARWSVVTATPSDRPAVLVSRLAGELAQAPGHDRRLVVLDQFEEFFTGWPDERERGRAFDRLAALPATVLIGLRADFTAEVSGHAGLAASLRDGPLDLQPMNEKELREAVTGPAASAGLDLEPGLAEVVLRDLGAGPGATRGPVAGALPFLSLALRATWENRDGTLLTLAGYHASGGVHGLVAALAEQTWTASEPLVRNGIRTTLPALIRVSETGDDTRARVARAVLAEQGTDPAALRSLIAARLVTVDAGAAEVTHDSVLTGWPRLRGWLDGDREHLVKRQRLEADAAEWSIRRRDRALLYRGSRLDAAEASTRRPSLPGLSATGRAFLTASRRRGRWFTVHR